MEMIGVGANRFHDFLAAALAKQAQVFLKQGFAGIKIAQRAVPAIGAVLTPQFRVA
jgi:hypothetical protein